jgi:hypothetical protein
MINKINKIRMFKIKFNYGLEIIKIKIILNIMINIFLEECLTNQKTMISNSKDNIIKKSINMINFSKNSNTKSTIFTIIEHY